MNRVLKNTMLVAAATATAAFASGAAAGGRSDLVLQALDAGNAQYVKGELLVQFKANAAADDQQAVRDRLSAQSVMVVRDTSAGRLELLRMPQGVSVASAVRLLDVDARVEFVEPNWTYTHQAVSNDTYYTNGSLWGMYGDATSPANQYGSQAGEAWANGKTDCSPVWVGVIDEGYMHTHEDLAANVGTNPGEIAGNGVDDDGNGYVDDVNGWDFDGGDNSVFDGVGDDHGTHVSGTIGAAGGNGKGVAGVCWNVKLINGKFLGKRGGTTANAVLAVDYMTDLKTRHGLDLVTTSNSWGGGGFSQALADAIERANAEDILFIAAAGNDGSDCDTSFNCYPAEYANSNIIGVASLDSNGGLSSFSNFGATTIDIGAPGRGIWSTLPVRVKGKATSGYGAYSGTSMATPHVSGAAALYRSQNPTATAAQVKAAIMNNAAPTSSLSGNVVTDGRLDVSGF